MKTFVLLSALLVSAGSVKAQSNEAKYYYWNGVAWTSSNNCQYTYTINLVNGGSNVSLDNIARMNKDFLFANLKKS